MLKMYVRAAHAGDRPEHWADSWGAFDHAAFLRDAARICHNDPVSRWVEPAVARGGLFLEGGCGLGAWVKWLHHRGHRALGVDFAASLVASLRRLDPALHVMAADVRALPLPDGCVQTYLSNGVVEHWEDGPDAGLAEARRVLARDGLFLCAVPDASWLRRRLFARELVERRGVAGRPVDGTRPERAPEGWRFYQYAFEVDEFGARLRAAGFDVLEATGEGLLHGLFEIPGLARVYDGAYRAARTVLRRGRRSSHGTAAKNSVADATDAFDRDPRSTWLERALFREEPQLPVVGPLVARAAEHCSTMRMYVARPR